MVKITKKYSDLRTEEFVKRIFRKFASLLAFSILVVRNNFIYFFNDKHLKWLSRCTLYDSKNDSCSRCDFLRQLSTATIRSLILLPGFTRTVGKDRENAREAKFVSSNLNKMVAKTKILGITCGAKHWRIMLRIC